MSQMGTFNGGGIFPPGSVVQTLEGNSGGPVSPNVSNNLFVVGDGMTIDVVGNPGTNTLTISAMGSVALQFDADSGSANPSGGVIHMSGGTNINTSAATNIVTFNLDDVVVVATSVTAANIELAANTISSVNSNGNIILNPNGVGTVNINYATTDSIAMYGPSGSLTQIGPLSNGQLIIGSTGNPPIANTITAGTGISVTNGIGSITIAATGTTTLTYTGIAHSDSPYTVLSTDEVIGADVTAGVITVKLPDAPATGRAYTIKDIAGLAATSNITVTTVSGAVNIDGATSFIMNSNYESINVLFNGSAYCIY